MPKLPSLTPKKIIKMLEKRGFILDRTKGSHHIYYHPETNRRVVVPLHKRDLPKGTLLPLVAQSDMLAHFLPMSQVLKFCDTAK